MALYYYLIDADLFHRRLRPALGDAWRGRSFEPARALCADFLAAAETFRERYRLGPDEFLVRRVADGLAFDREAWRYLVAEVLLLAAADVPEADDALDGLRLLLAPGLDAERPSDRGALHPVEQAHRGSRDLLLGGAFYRPERAGYNDCDDVARLADYLDAVNPAAWSPDSLADLEGMEDAAEREEELAYLRQCFAALRAIYQRARRERQVIVCETLG